MIPSPVNIGCESDKENMQPQHNGKASTDEQPYIKRPVTARMLWFRDQRRKKPLKYKRMNISKMIKRVNVEWNQLPVEVKQPYIDEAHRLKEQHPSDHPECQFRPWLRPQTVVKTFDKAVVPYGMSSSFSPAFNAKESMPNLLVPGYVPENRSNFLTGCIPTHDMHSTTYPAISYDSITQPAESRTFLSMASRNTLTQQEDSPFQLRCVAENRSNSLTGCIPTHNMHSTTYPAISYDSITQLAESRTFLPIPRPARNTSTPFYEKVLDLRRKGSAQEMDSRDYVQSNTISSSLDQHSFPEPQHSKELTSLNLSVFESTLDLSVKKDQ